MRHLCFCPLGQKGGVQVAAEALNDQSPTLPSSRAQKRVSAGDLFHNEYTQSRSGLKGRVGGGCHRIPAYQIAFCILLFAHSVNSRFPIIFYYLFVRIFYSAFIYWIFCVQRSTDRLNHEPILTFKRKFFAGARLYHKNEWWRFVRALSTCSAFQLSQLGHCSWESVSESIIFGLCVTCSSLFFKSWRSTSNRLILYSFV